MKIPTIIRRVLGAPTRAEKKAAESRQRVERFHDAARWAHGDEFAQLFENAPPKVDHPHKTRVTPPT